MGDVNNMDEKSNLISSDLLKNNQSDLKAVWLNEIKNNPHFFDSGFHDTLELDSYTDDLLKNAFFILESDKVPDFSISSFQPLIELWRNLLKKHREAGFTSKDSAMLVFSLKSAMLTYVKKYFKGDDYQYGHHLDKFRSLLDFLGLLTFEIYSSEKESLITNQSDQIEFLQNLQSKLSYKGIIGESNAMQSVYKAMGVVLEADITVLLEGETGTGKDLIASTIHDYSSRSKKPYITINCGAIPKELIASELFGHEKGSFTGAISHRVGKFELANGGTLFLDEIGELSLDMQVSFLRVLQNKEIERVGGSQKIPIDVRVVAATNKSLKKMVDQNLFRADLFYRLNVFPINIPSLSQRKEDVIPLAYHFIDVYTKEFNIDEPPTLTSDAIDFLLTKTWKGNIRELENLIQRAILLSRGKYIHKAMFVFGSEDIPLKTSDDSVNSLLDTDDVIPLEDLERKALLHALNVTNYNIQKSAKLLGISRGTFYNKLKRYNISFN